MLSSCGIRLTGIVAIGVGRVIGPTVVLVARNGIGGCNRAYSTFSAITDPISKKMILDYRIGYGRVYSIEIFESLRWSVGTWVYALVVSVYHYEEKYGVTSRLT